jgi:hypothetical protein
LKPIENPWFELKRFELKRAFHKHRLRISRIWKDSVWRNGSELLPICCPAHKNILEKVSVLLSSKGIKNRGVNHF